MSRRLRLRQALALGLLHGPTELLPVSSSAHTALVPWLAGWDYPALDARLRKSFEVALHAGTAAALLLRPPLEGGWASRSRQGPSLGFMAGALAPPALAGYTLHARIERRLGTPATIAAGLLAGSLFTLCAEARARRQGAAAARRAEPTGRRMGRWVLATNDRFFGIRFGIESGIHFGIENERVARFVDGLAVGIAQGAALVPGVSRSGAAFAAARARGFGPAEADRLSWQAGAPVIAGAGALQSYKLLRDGMPPGAAPALAVGASAAFASTLIAGRLLSPRRRTAAVLPACLYRVALAGTVARRVSRGAAGKPTWQDRN